MSLEHPIKFVGLRLRTALPARSYAVANARAPIMIRSAKNRDTVGVRYSIGRMAHSTETEIELTSVEARCSQTLLNECRCAAKCLFLGIFTRSLNKRAVGSSPSSSTIVPHECKKLIPKADI